jgi:SdrD B-like domain/RTX calcium-binding nonapeptide repeat (4 copies)
MSTFLKKSDYLHRVSGRRASRSGSIRIRHRTLAGLERLEDRLAPAVVDLTTLGASGSINSAIFSQFTAQSSGTGVFSPFVRLSSDDPVQQGYNTDFRPVQFDESSNSSLTHALKLSAVPTVIAPGGLAYYEFPLSIDQERGLQLGIRFGGRDNNLISLDELRLYVTTASTVDPTLLHNYSPSTHTLQDDAGKVYAPLYDLNPVTDVNYVKLNADLSRDSGPGDMVALIPVTLLGTDTSQYVYLYSEFGVHNADHGGSEEWAASPVVPVGSIQGLTFIDQKGSGALDPGDPGQGGVTVYLDANNNGTLDPGEVSTVTASDGTFSFSNVLPGTYHVREVVPPGYFETARINADITLSAGQNVTGVDFGNGLPGSISGTKFEDVTGNGFSSDDPVLNASNPDFVPVTVRLSQGSTVVATTTTDSTGSYTFSNVIPGPYTLTEVAPNGWVETAARSTSVMLGSGAALTGNDFDNFLVAKLNSAGTLLTVRALPAVPGSLRVTQDTSNDTNVFLNGVEVGTFNAPGLQKIDVTSAPGYTVDTTGVTTVPLELHVPQGDQTIMGGSNGIVADLNIGSSVSISVTGGENTLNFAPTQFGITFNPNLNQGQMQQLDGSGTHFAAISGTFQNIVGTGKNDTLFAPDPVVQGPVTLQSFQASHTTLTESGGNNTLYAAPMSTITVAQGSSALYVGLPTGVAAPNLSTLFNAINTLVNQNPANAGTLFQGLGNTIDLGSSNSTVFAGPMTTVNGGINSTMYVGLPSGVTAPDLQTLFQGISSLAGKVDAQTLFDGVRTTFNPGPGGTSTMFTSPVSSFVGGANSNNTMYVGLPSGVSAPDLQTLFQGISQLTGGSISASTLFNGVRPTFTGGTGGTNTMFSGPVSGFVGGANSSNTMYVGLPSGVAAPDLQTLFQGIGQLAGSNISASTVFDGARATFTGGSGGTNTMFSGPVSGFVGGANSSNTMYVGLPSGLTAPDLQTLFQGIQQLAGSSTIASSTLFDGARATFTGGSGGTNTMFTGPVSSFIGGDNSNNTMFVGLPSGVMGPDLQTLFQGMNQFVGNTISANSLFDGVRPTFTGGNGGTDTMYTGVMGTYVGNSGTGTLYAGLPQLIPSTNIPLVAVGLPLLFNEIAALVQLGGDPYTLFSDLVIHLNGGPNGDLFYSGTLSQAQGGVGNDVMYAALPAGFVGPDPQALQAEINTLVTSYGANASALQALLTPVLDGGPGDNVLFGAPGATLRSGGTGDNTLYAAVPAFNDSHIQLPAPTTPTTLVGGGGNDTFVFTGLNLGHVFVVENNETSNSTLDFSNYAGPVTVDISRTDDQVVNPGNLILTLSDSLGIEHVVGSPYSDSIRGNGRASNLAGGHFLDDRATQPPPAPNAAIQNVLLDFDTNTNPQTQHVYTPDERQAILGRLQTMYALFPWVQFTLTQPTSGQYVTEFFNKSGAGEEPGGQSDEIDFGNLHLYGTASINVNGLLGGAGQPPATTGPTGNYVALSATIAGHELGHLLGLEHSDAFGPIGSGIHNPPGPGVYIPDYPAPAAAFETDFHVIASPASVGSTLFDAVGTPFFGEREAVKLAFDHDGTYYGNAAVVDDTVTPHSSTAAALPLVLRSLTVPNTETNGLDAGKTLAVAATAVNGFIGIDPMTGHSGDDYYSFTGRAGDVINLEVMSGLLARIKDPIDSVLSVYDSSGKLVNYYGQPAFNDDKNQTIGDHDSALYDLKLPADGTYYVKVDTFAFAPGDPGYGGPTPAGMDTATGHYVLFVYRFDAAFAQDPGDTLAAGPGNATLRGGPGNDTFIVGPGHDTVIGGGGSDTVQDSGAASYILVDGLLTGTGTAKLQSVRNAVLTGGAGGTTFNVSGWTGTATLVGVGGVNTVVVNRDTNFILSANTLVLANGGTFKLVNIQNVLLTGGPSGSSFNIGGWNGAATLTGVGGTNTVVASRNANFVLSDPLLTVSGGGTFTLVNVHNAVLTGGVSGSTFDVRAWTGTDTLNGQGGANPVVTPRGAAISTTEGPTTMTVANFTDGGTTVAGTYSASIDWGDNSSSAGGFSASGQAVSATGTHFYKEEGSYTVTTSIHQGTAFTVIVNSKAAVVDAQLTAAHVPGINAKEGRSTGTVIVATFTDPGGSEPVGAYKAVINWGDKSATGAGTIVDGGNGNFRVTASHLYHEDGNYTLTVTLTHDSLPAVIVSGKARVTDVSLTASSLIALRGIGVNTMGGAGLAAGGGVSTALMSATSGPAGASTASRSLTDSRASSGGATTPSSADHFFLTTSSGTHSRPHSTSLETTDQFFVIQPEPEW